MMEKLRWLAALTTTSVVALEMSPSTTLTFVPLIVKLNRSVIAGADIEASYVSFAAGALTTEHRYNCSKIVCLTAT